MRSWPTVISCAWSLWVLGSSPLQAFTYEVLFEESLARDAVQFGRTAAFAANMKSVLLDGKVETSGTHAVTYNRLLVNSLRILQQLPLTASSSLRLTLPLVGTYEKQEGQQVPRIISEAAWLEARPKLELIYATQSGLDLVLGLNLHYISAYDVETRAANFNAKDRYGSALSNFGHLAVVKHGGHFDGGFAFQLNAEKARSVTKTNTLDSSELEFDDIVYDPTTIAFFFQSQIGSSRLYGEFAAVEASGGGNRTETGLTVKEDYFRVQLSGLFPLGLRDLRLESTLLYKNLSYADNGNVTLDTIPMLGLHVKVHANIGVPVYAGLIGVRGSDGQSLQEFNANYTIVGVGATIGVATVL